MYSGLDKPSGRAGVPGNGSCTGADKEKSEDAERGEVHIDRLYWARRDDGGREKESAKVETRC